MILGFWTDNVNFLNIRTPKVFVVITLKIELQATLFISKSRGPEKILRVINSLR